MTDPITRIEVSRALAADPAEVFADPNGHVEIDASGMLMAAEGPPVQAAGDRFTMHMHRRSLRDLDWEAYDVEVVITTFERDREIAWTVEGRMKPPSRNPNKSLWVREGSL